MNHRVLRERGFGDADADRAVEERLAEAFDIRFVFNRWTCWAMDFCRKKLGLTDTRQRPGRPGISTCCARSASRREEIEAANALRLR